MNFGVLLNSFIITQLKLELAQRNYIHCTTSYIVVPPNTANLGTGEEPVFRNGGIGREYNLKHPIWGLKRAAVLGGRQYWEGRY